MVNSMVSGFLRNCLIRPTSSMIPVNTLTPPF
jgi:hypothetical protein